MKDHLQQIFNSGVSLSVVNGRLKVAGASEIVENFRPLLKQYRDEIITRLQATGTPQNRLVMVEHGNSQTNAAQTTPEQSFFALPCSAEDKALMADAVILIDVAEKTRPEIAPELIRAFNTVEAGEIEGNQTAFDFALSALRVVVEDSEKINLVL